jgi:short-subunit dehydrogenase
MSKKLLTIGAGPGIGLATAKRFADAGFELVLGARNPTKLREHAEALFGSNFQATYVPVDAGSSSQVADLIAKTQPDVLHYNTGVLRYKADGGLVTDPITKFPIDDIESDIRVNLTGALVGIKEALKVMEPRGAGAILLTGGGLALSPHADLLTLSVGKAALRAAAQALFEPAKKAGVHVALVTVAKLISAGSPEANDVADQFWQMYTQPQDSWTWEETYA